MQSRGFGRLWGAVSIRRMARADSAYILGDSTKYWNGDECQTSYVWAWTDGGRHADFVVQKTMPIWIDPVAPSHGRIAFADNWCVR